MVSTEISQKVVEDGSVSKSVRATEAVARLGVVEKYALSFMEEAWEHAREKNQTKHNKFQLLRKLLIGDCERKRNYKGTADLWPPKLFEAIDALLPLLSQILLPDTEAFVVEAQGEEVLRTESFLKRLSALHQTLTLSSMEDMRYDLTFLRGLRCLLTYGTQIKMAKWTQESRMMQKERVESVPVVDPETGEVIGTEEKSVLTLESVLVRDHADFELIDPWDFFPGDIRQFDVDTMDFCFRQFSATLTGLRKGVYYHNLEIIEQLGSGKATDQEGAVRDKKLGKDVACQEGWFQPGIFDPRDAPGVKQKDLVAFCKKYGCQPEQFPGAWVITRGDELCPIRIGPNPFKRQDVPFIVSRCFEFLGEFWGVGFCELGESYQREIADKRNQAMDAVTEALRSHVAVRGDAVGGNTDTLDEWTSGNGMRRTILLDPVGQVPISELLQEYRSTINPNHAFQASQVAELDLQRALGVASPMSGSTSGNDVTATETTQAAEGGAGRVQLRARELETSDVKPVLQWIYRMNQQFFPRPGDPDGRKKAIKVAGPNGVNWETLTEEDFALDLKFTPRTARNMANRLAITNQISNAVASGAWEGVANKPWLWEEMLRAWRLDNPKRGVLQPQERPQEIPVEMQHQLFEQGHSSPVEPSQPLPASQQEVAQHQQIFQQRMSMGRVTQLEARVILDHLAEHQFYDQAKMIAMQQAQLQGEMGQGPEGGGAGQPTKPKGPSGPAGPGGNAPPMGDMARMPMGNQATGPEAMSPGGMGRAMIPMQEGMMQ